MDVAEIWYKMWIDGRAPGEIPITWDILKTAFLERFFPRDNRESKVEVFINLRQGGMSVKEYSFKFVKLSKYTSSLVSSRMDQMSMFVTGVSEDLEEDCWAAILHDYMDLARLMVHAQQIEEIRWRERGREGKKPRPRVMLVLALVEVRLESRTCPSSRRGTSTQVILLLPGKLIPKGTSLAPRRAMIEMPSVT